jgi:PhnB protein
MADVKPIPDEYPQVIPYLNVDDAAAAIKFYVDVFGGTERMRMDGPPGKIAHAEVEIGRGMIMLADEMPDAGNRSARAIGATPVAMMVYVEDVDSVFGKALAAGAKELRPLENKFYGDRSGTFEDPWGHHWDVSSHVEDVSEDEMMRRASEAMGGPPS